VGTPSPAQKSFIVQGGKEARFVGLRRSKLQTGWALLLSPHRTLAQIYFDAATINAAHLRNGRRLPPCPGGRKRSYWGGEGGRRKTSLGLLGQKRRLGKKLGCGSERSRIRLGGARRTEATGLTGEEGKRKKKEFDTLSKGS